MRILLIEDDPLISRDVTAHLARASYVVEGESDGEAGWYHGAEEDFAAVVLDLGLPGMDRLSALKRWRDAGRVSRY